MKKHLIIILILLSVKIVSAQNVEYQKLSMVHENKQIDSIIDDFKQSNHRAIYKNDSCFLIRINTLAEKNYRLLVSYVEFDNSNHYVEKGDFHDSYDFKFFKYKNNTVFVMGNLNFGNWFVSTSKKKLFAFKRLNSSDKKISPKDLSSITYKYFDGKFQPNYTESPGPRPDNYN